MFNAVNGQIPLESGAGDCLVMDQRWCSLVLHQVWQRKSNSGVSCWGFDLRIGKMVQSSRDDAASQGSLHAQSFGGWWMLWIGYRRVFNIR